MFLGTNMTMETKIELSGEQGPVKAKQMDCCTVPVSYM